LADQIEFKADIPDFRRQLQEVGARMEKKIVTAGLRAAGVVFRTAARQLAPVLRKADARRVPGALRRAIFVGRSRFNKGRGVVSYYIGVRASKARKARGEDPFYWRFLEGGWTPNIAKQAQRRLRGQRKGGEFSFPFLAPAFRGSQGAALKAFVDRVSRPGRRRRRSTWWRRDRPHRAVGRYLRERRRGLSIYPDVIPQNIALPAIANAHLDDAHRDDPLERAGGLHRPSRSRAFRDRAKRPIRSPI
jgi:hypothetical protein